MRATLNLFWSLLTKLTLILSLAFSIAMTVQSSEPYAYAIVTFNSEIQPLRSNQVKMLYRGRLSHINGIPTRLMDLPKASEHRNNFYRKLLNKSPSQMSAIWAKQSFSGKALAPFEIENETKQEIISWLKQNKNGVAYVPNHLIPEDAYVIYQM